MATWKDLEVRLAKGLTIDKQEMALIEAERKSHMVRHPQQDSACQCTAAVTIHAARCGCRPAEENYRFSHLLQNNRIL
ncbi:unnamed protein product [Boreogadus saida]